MDCTLREFKKNVENTVHFFTAKERCMAWALPGWGSRHDIWKDLRKP